MSLIRRSIIIAALAVSSMGGMAWADDCAELFQQMAASRKMINDAIGDEKTDIVDLMDRNRAISSKMHSRCQDKYDTYEQQAWERQQEPKTRAAKACVELRNFKPKGSYYNETEKETEQDDNTEKAAECLSDLFPFGATLNPNLKTCRDTCAQAFEKFVKRTPECLEAIEKANDVLNEMRAFVEDKKKGKTQDVLVDFNVYSAKYDRVGLRKCILPDTVPEIKARYNQLREEANIIGHYDEAKRDFEKMTASGKNWSPGSAQSCMSSVWTVPVRDPKFDKWYEECRVMRDKLAHPPSSNGPAPAKAPAKAAGNTKHGKR
jgi:hypothetical protein